MRNGIVLAGLLFAVVALVSFVLVVPSNATRDRGLRVRHMAPLAQTNGTVPMEVQGQHRIRFRDAAAQTATANLGRIRPATPALVVELSQAQ